MGIWWPGEAAPNPSPQLLHDWVSGVNWGSKCPTVLVSLSGVGVVADH